MSECKGCTRLAALVARYKFMDKYATANSFSCLKIAHEHTARELHKMTAYAQDLYRVVSVSRDAAVGRELLLENAHLRKTISELRRNMQTSAPVAEEK